MRPTRDRRGGVGKLELYLAEVEGIAGGPLKIEVVRPRGGAGGGNDPTSRTVWVVDVVSPQSRQEIVAHEATHIALYYEGWAFARTPATGADVGILQGIGALLTNAVQHPEIARRLLSVRIDARPGHRANAMRRVSGLARFNRATTHLEDIHEALFQMDMAFVPSGNLRQRVETEFARAFPAAVSIRDALEDILGAGPTSPDESVKVARRMLQVLELAEISVATT